MSDCPPVEKIASYLLDELADHDGQVILHHIDECRRCEEVMAELAEELALGEERSSPKNEVASNLLFGLLALHNSFISRAQLVAATSEWLEDKSRAIQDILVQQRAITEDQCKLVQALVAQHLATHDSVEQSLAELSSFQLVKDDLQRLNDPDVEASLSLMRTLDSKPESETVVRPSTFHPERERFKQLHPHAKGGLGEVYVARDQQLDRNVALKRIQPRLADDQMSRLRFEQEAEVTGKLEHPGVVPVYGRGADDTGRPFYAMRFIKGRTFKEEISQFHKAHGATDWRSAAARLGLRSLIARLIDVCNTVEYAHYRGVLHRDLKPDNVMLGKFGETILVDWGLAKKAGSAVPDSSPSQRDESLIGVAAGSDSSPTPTTFGTVVGTLGYMSPEQAAGRVDELGPPSDVYGLGAILYRLLTDKSSQSSKVDKLEVLEKIEKGDFPRPREIKSQVPRPLESICMKAMAVKSADRYPTARQLAEDLECWLAAEHVGAHAENLVEKSLRLARRYRGWVAASVGAAAVLAATWIAVLMAREAELASAQARQHLLDAQATVDSWLTGSAEDLSDYPGVHRFRLHLLNEAAERYQAWVANPRIEDPRYELERGRTLLRLGDMRRELAANAEELNEAKRDFETAESVLRPLTELKSDVAVDAVYELANCHFRLGRIAQERGEDSSQMFRAATDAYRDLAVRDPQQGDYKHGLGTTLVHRASNLIHASEFQEAEHLLRQAIDEFQAALSIQPGNASFIRGLSTARSLIGEALRQQGNVDEAEDYFVRAVAHCEELVNTNPVNLELQADARSYLAQIHRRQGRSRQVLEACQQNYTDYKSLRDHSPAVTRYREAAARAAMDLGQSLHLLGETKKARAKLEESRDVFRELASATGAPRHIEEWATSLDNLALITSDLGDFDSAIEQAEAAVSLFDQLLNTFGDRIVYRHRLAVSQSRLGQVLHRRKNVEGANQAFIGSAMLLEELIETTKPAEARPYVRDLAEVWQHCGAMLLVEERIEEATETLAEAKRRWTEVESDSPANQNGSARFLISSPVSELADAEHAVELATSATKTAPDNSDFIATLGAAYYRSGNYQKAADELIKAAELRGSPRAFDLYYLGMAQYQRNEISLAKESFERGSAWFDANMPGNRVLARLKAEVEKLLKSAK